MIQLPSKIRTTLFNASIEPEPYQLFSHEDDRLVIFITPATTNEIFPAVGRSKQAVLAGGLVYALFSTPLTIFGPEPLWIGAIAAVSSPGGGFLLVHAVYRA